MAKRPVFFEKNGIVMHTDIEFQWFAGFAVSQKQKSINALHTAIREKFSDAAPLEISTKRSATTSRTSNSLRRKASTHRLVLSCSSN